MYRPKTTALVVSFLLSLPAFGTVINPFAFNVFTVGDIGTTDTGYSSDFQGVAATGGNAYFQNFSLHDVASAGPGTPYSLYAGGDVRIGGSINNGGIEAAGSVYINGASVYGDVSAGGDLLGTGGNVYGAAHLGGQDQTGNEVTVRDGVSQDSPFSPTLPLASLADYFLGTSAYLGSLSATTTYNNQWGELRINLEPGLNIVDIASADLNAAWGIRVNGGSDSILVINVPDGTVEFDSITWDYRGNASPSRTLLNAGNATSMQFTSGNHMVNILAPRADVNFPHGLLTGNLIAGNLTGGGQVNAGYFTGDIIPEPASILLIFAALATRRR
jgi:choice-of-anchor A domain-containing protein